MKWIFLILILAGQLANGSLVDVHSTFTDLSKPERKLKVSGSGFVFKYLDRAFVFTASHVSQGEEGIGVEHDGKPLQVIGRAMSPESDLELLEVQGVALGEVTTTYDGANFLFVDPPGVRQRWIDSYDYVPLLASVKDPNLSIDNSFARARDSVLGMDYFSRLLHGECLVQPGTSGAPLVSEIPDTTQWKTKMIAFDPREGLSNVPIGQRVVRGLAIRRERFFTQCYFVPLFQMRALLQDYLNKQTQKPKVKWQATGALLYRVEIEEGLRETTSFAASTAGGVIVDQGNGVTMEGGDLATLAEDMPKDFLSKVSAFPSFGGESPQMYWLLYMRHPTTSVLINFWCWFDMEFYTRLSQFMMATHEKEGTHMDLVSQLYPRFGKRRDFEIETPQYLKVDRAGVLAKLKLADGDTLEFQLNREGIYCENAVCPQRFSPVIEVPSSKDLIYLVDLHQFFFADASHSMMPSLRVPGAEKLSQDQIKNEIYDSLALEPAHPIISLRKKRSDLTRSMTLQEGLPQTIQW